MTTDGSTGPGLPLSGVRVVDLTMVWAGPYATKMLADIGAEVIKIEGPARVDLTRILTIPPGEITRTYDASRYFNEYNRNKLGMAIDVQQPAGLEIVRQLVAVSDVLIENFRPGVLDRLGLGYETLKAINPRIIVVSLPGYSGIEPERGLPAYGPNIEQMGGLAYLNGYIGGPPHKSGISYGDPIAGLGGVSAVLLALLQRERTGEGQYIEVSQRNLLLGLIGDALVAQQFGATFERTGNRSTVYAPQGVYACAAPGPDSPEPGEAWLAVSVITDDQWTALCDVIGRPDLAADDSLRSVVGRMEAHDKIDAIVSEWAATVGARPAATALQARGVPAAPVLGPAGLREDPQLQSRNFLRTLPHPELGEMRITAPVWHFDGLDLEVRPAPAFGEHNHQVLADILGYDPNEIAELEAAGVIADQPRQP